MRNARATELSAVNGQMSLSSRNLDIQMLLLPFGCFLDDLGHLLKVRKSGYNDLFIPCKGFVRKY